MLRYSRHVVMSLHAKDDYWRTGTTKYDFEILILDAAARDLQHEQS